VTLRQDKVQKSARGNGIDCVGFSCEEAYGEEGGDFGNADLKNAEVGGKFPEPVRPTSLFVQSLLRLTIFF